MNARADSSSVEVVGLERSLAYSVAVAAATNAGIGVKSTSVVAEPFTNTGKQQTLNSLMFRLQDPFYMSIHETLTQAATWILL